jgi:hypothetical protein
MTLSLGKLVYIYENWLEKAIDQEQKWNKRWMYPVPITFEVWRGTQS